MEIQCAGLRKQNRKKSKAFRKRTHLINGFAVCLFYHSQLYAHNWRLTPYLQLQEIYSDNINLAASGKAKSAFVTELSPGASIIWQAGKSSLNLRYNMQNLYNARGDEGLSINHQLQFNAHNILLKNRLFVDSRASISQQNTNNHVLASDNISGVAGSATTVTTYGISPTWLPNFGNYASGMVRVNADRISTGASNLLSDATNLSEMVQLNSGNEFKRVSWAIGFNNYESYRSGTSNIQFQTSTATLRSYLDRYFSVFGTVGYSNNSFNSNTSSNQNGFFYTFGARWMPSRHYWIEAGGGNNSYVTVSIAPTQRFNWMTTVRDNTVGLNSGITWQTALNYNTRQSKWSLSHTNDTTTVQDALVKLENDPTNPSQGTGSIPVNTSSFTNDVMVRQLWNLSASFYTGKSNISLNLFNQDRTYQINTNKEHVIGVSALWNWQFARKTSLYLRPQWQQIDENKVKNVRSQDNRYDFAIGLRQLITSRINGVIELRHIDQTSDLTTNNYQENRATANLFMRF